MQNTVFDGSDSALEAAASSATPTIQSSRDEVKLSWDGAVALISSRAPLSGAIPTPPAPIARPSPVTATSATTADASTTSASSAKAPSTRDSHTAAMAAARLRSNPRFLGRAQAMQSNPLQTVPTNSSTGASSGGDQQGAAFADDRSLASLRSDMEDESARSSMLTADVLCLND